MSPLSFLVRLLGLTVMVIFLSASTQALAQDSQLPTSDHAPVITDITVEEAALENNSNAVNDKKQYGSGLRYLSDGPAGGSRIEYGRPLDRGPDDSSGQWEFTMGSMF